jgi:hypothetical protein
MEKDIAKLESKIQTVKAKLMALGEMRPGVLTMQYKKPKEKEGGFYQLSYTHRMKSKTEYVRPQFVKETKKLIGNFKKFKQLTQEWVDLSLELAQLKIQIAKEKNVS